MSRSVWLGDGEGVETLVEVTRGRLWRDIDNGSFKRRAIGRGKEYKGARYHDYACRLM